MEVEWLPYMQHRAAEREFELDRLEQIVRFSNERYLDTSTGRYVAIGKHDNRLVLVAYEMGEGTYRPVTVHLTTRTQVFARLKAGRYANE